MDDLLIDFTKAMRPIETPLLNYAQRFGVTFPSRPVVGHTPERRVRRFVWSRFARLGHRLQDRLARYERYDDEEYGRDLYTRRDWRWVEAVGRRSIAAMPQPIYDMDWVPPKPVTLQWGWVVPAAMNDAVFAVERSMLVGNDEWA